MRRLFTIATLGAMLTSAPVFAADDNNTQSLAPAVTAAATALAQNPTVANAIDFTPRHTEDKRPAVLPALYAGTVALQAYDAYSTLSVLKHGGMEANPVMKNVVKSPTAFVALKAGVATMSIMAAEKMWKSNNRVGAVITMVASNGFMAWVAAHNASVLNQVR